MTNPINNPPHDLARSTLQLLFIGVLIAGSFWVLKPFLLALIWATMIVVATWPLLLSAQSRLWGKRSIAAAVMVLGMLLILIAPLSLAVVTVVEHAGEIVDGSKSLVSLAKGPPPDWVERLPLVGSKVAAEWRKMAAGGAAGLATSILPYVDKIVGWFVSQVGTLGMLVFHSLLTLFIASILYLNGEVAAAGVRRFARRLGGSSGENAIQLAAQAIRGVALGVIVTAVVQSALAGIGLAVVGVPYAGLLTAVMMLFGIAQLGSMPVLVPSVIWVYWQGDTVWGTVFLIWTVIVGGIDNVLRPYLIRKGANLPLLLIFAGVLGGLIAFGIVGLFVGPVLLAVSYTLLAAWMQDGDPENAAGSESTGSEDHKNSRGIE